MNLVLRGLTAFYNCCPSLPCSCCHYFNISKRSLKQKLNKFVWISVLNTQIKVLFWKSPVMSLNLMVFAWSLSSLITLLHFIQIWTFPSCRKEKTYWIQPLPHETLSNQPHLKVHISFDGICKLSTSPCPGTGNMKMFPYAKS